MLFLSSEKTDENPELGRTLPERIMLSKVQTEINSQKHNLTTNLKQKKDKKKVHNDEKKTDFEAKESITHQKANKASKVNTNQQDQKKTQQNKMRNSAENQKVDAHAEVYEEEKF